ncbi:MAG: ATP-binding protein [Acetobacteraceae bacterium]
MSELEPVAARRSLPAWVASRLKGRADTEHEMSVNRFAFAAVITGYLILAGAPLTGAAVLGMAVLGLYAAVTMVHILVSPAVNIPRRYAALVMDIGFVAYEMHVGDDLTAILYPVYLWVIFGNGFRFGIAYLRAAMLVSMASFAIVVATTPFWYQLPALSAGLMIGLLILPLYAGILIRKLSTAKEQAEAANRVKGQFLASVSHELRTPLNAVIGMGAMLLDTRLDDEQRDMARTMQDAGRALLSQIESILGFARVEAGRMPFTEVDFDFLAVLTETRALLRAQCHDKALWLGIRITPRTPVALFGDEHHLREILLNLCANAVKFTDSGSIVLSADAEALAGGRVRLRCEVSDTGIGIAAGACERIFERFTQADASIVNRFGGTGLGLAICKRLVEHLGGEIGVDSEPGKGSSFWFTLPVGVRPATPLASDRLDDLTTVVLTNRPRPGEAFAEVMQAASLTPHYCTSTAELLAAVRSAGRRGTLVLFEEDGILSAPDVMAEALHRSNSLGRMTLVLLSERRTRRDSDRLFSMVLPGVPDHEQLMAAVRLALAVLPERVEPSVPSAATAKCPLHVLVADDNRTNQKVIAKILERGGHSVITVGDGEAALDALDEEPFDLVLMDVNMPKMDGLEATKLWRMAELSGPRRPIIGLTADATPQMHERCIESGMDACVSKPIEPQELLETIATLTSQRPLLPAAVSSGPAEVTDIASHPQFRIVSPPMLDGAMLKELERLGGSEFVDDLIQGFLEDAAQALQELDAAARKRDPTLFRAKAHAVCSGASNIGARRVNELCRPWNTLRDSEVAEHGRTYVAQLTGELERLREHVARVRTVQGRPG